MRIANLTTSSMARAARRRMLAKRTERQLRQLDESQLADIGVNPTNLRAVAWDLARRRIPEETVANDQGQAPSDQGTHRAA